MECVHVPYAHSGSVFRGTSGINLQWKISLFGERDKWNTLFQGVRELSCFSDVSFKVFTNGLFSR